MVCYCSRECQKQDWRGGHKQLCQNTCQAGEGEILNSYNLILPFKILKAASAYLTGPDIRFLTHVIAGDIMNLPLDFTKYAAHTASSGLVSPRTRLLLMKYNSPSRDEGACVKATEIDFDNPVLKSYFAEDYPHLKETWRGAWSLMKAPKSSKKSQTLPVLVVIPGRASQPQTITGLFTAEWSSRGPTRTRAVNVRWVHHT